MLSIVGTMIGDRNRAKASKALRAALAVAAVRLMASARWGNSRVHAREIAIRRLIHVIAVRGPIVRFSSATICAAQGCAFGELGEDGMRATGSGRRTIEKELANLRKATDKASAHLKKASRDVSGRLSALERMVERGLTSEDLWDRLEVVSQELEILRQTSEKELAKLRQSSEREFRALLSASGRIARIILSGPSRRRRLKSRTRATSKKQPVRSATKATRKTSAKTVAAAH